VRRGRPRHDDILTPREWEVLELLRDGLSNEAIAARLGVSLDTAKYHVSEILGKLGVSSREEASRWRGEPRRGWAWLPPWAKWPFTAGALAGAVVILGFAAGVFDGADDGDEVPALTGGALDDFGPTPTVTAAAALHLDEAAELEITTCINDDTWTKPSLQEQVDYINADGRYRPFDDNKSAQFDAAFWLGAGPASGRPNPFGKLITGSGLWTLGEKRDTYASLDRGCPDEPNVVEHAGLVDIWLFGFAAISGRWQDGQTIVTVESKPAGFQAVQLRYPGPARDYAGPYVFVDDAGRTVGIIQDASWSAPP
jgi:DNA-binding CsgD family transcriptional regulator